MPHPDILLRQITSTQFTEWIAYATLEQVGENRVIPEKESPLNRRARVEGGFKRMFERQSKHNA